MKKQTESFTCPDFGKPAPLSDRCKAPFDSGVGFSSHLRGAHDMSALASKGLLIRQRAAQSNRRPAPHSHGAPFPPAVEPAQRGPAGLLLADGHEPAPELTTAPAPHPAPNSQAPALTLKPGLLAGTPLTEIAPHAITDLIDFLDREFETVNAQREQLTSELETLNDTADRVASQLDHLRATRDSISAGAVHVAGERGHSV